MCRFIPGKKQIFNREDTRAQPTTPPRVLNKRISRNFQERRLQQSPHTCNATLTNMMILLPLPRASCNLQHISRVLLPDTLHRKKTAVARGKQNALRIPYITKPFPSIEITQRCQRCTGINERLLEKKYANPLHTIRPTKFFSIKHEPAKE